MEPTRVTFAPRWVEQVEQKELDAGRLHCRSMVWVRKAGR
ncbi:hypothetical protein ABID62_003298 [Bradyrhizobium sp. S3.9.1]